MSRDESSERWHMRRMVKAALVAMLVAGGPAAASAQVRTVDPNSAIDADRGGFARSRRPGSGGAALP